MPSEMYPPQSRTLAEQRKALTPEIEDAFTAFSNRVMADGALDGKVKQLIAIACAHVTQCPYCIQIHTKLAARRGATAQEIMEAVWVAAEMRAGAAYTHSAIAFAALEEAGKK